MMSHSKLQPTHKPAFIPHLAAGSTQQTDNRISLLQSLFSSTVVIFGSRQEGSSREFLAKNRQTGGE